ncbi:MAG: sigma-70 family RNA polymerase sigma factor [Gemmataceae bacterium]
MDPEILLARARSGDAAAWNDLLGWCRPLVRVVLKRQLPGHPDEASELTNDVLLRMHHGLAGFRGQATAQLLAWAFVIARNLIRDFIRREKARVSCVSLPLDHVWAAPPEDTSPAIQPQDLLRLAQALESLRPDYRRLIEAQLFDGLRPIQVAHQLDWPPVRVRVYTHRAVKLLASQVGKNGEEFKP